MSKRKGLSGASNGNWKGGKTVNSSGYVLIRVGIGHPMADVRGYAYEHRIVAAKMLGRPLRNGEIVHHKNGIKKDNRAANLEVLINKAEHGRVIGRDFLGFVSPGKLTRCWSANVDVAKISANLMARKDHANTSPGIIRCPLPRKTQF